MSSTIDVLVIGAGPAGLMCALNLSQAGFKVRIVDKKLERVKHGQGVAVQIRGIEILDSLGMASKLLAETHRCVHVATYASSPTTVGTITRVSRKSNIQGIESPVPLVALYSQSSVEETLREAMASDESRIPSATFQPQAEPHSLPLKVEVEQGVWPTKLSISEDADQEYPVTVNLTRSDGEAQTVRAKYLLGCDGAHSWTRSQIGLEMVGETTDQVWGAMDAHVKTDFPDIRALTFLENGGRQAMLIPRENDMVRFAVQVTDSDSTVDRVTGRIDRTTFREDQIKELVRKIYSPYTIEFTKPIEWCGIYVVGQRLASKYQDRSGRVFILGDACHTHSPHAGQGMNAALSDGHNLSWKLIHVLRGWAGPSLLSTYESERRGFAQELMALQEKIAQIISGKVKDTLSEAVSKSLRFVSGIETNYPPSPIVDTTNQALAPGIIIGERMPHQVILRTADFKPHSTLDLLRSNNLYKLLVFAGDPRNPVQYQRLENLGNDFSQLLDDSTNMLQLFTITIAKKENAEYLDVPSPLLPHWDSTFIDDVAFVAQYGGGRAYQSLQVGPEGCIVLVRPDGHVAALAPLEGAGGLRRFFETLKN